ncbi:DUF5926 family protein [Nocardioides iriomotensis]|uniref:SEC-C domain-containing protein n=1 Tax=Nocardioides iriomotensis TaxID=715784 RepID=A0A4Q5IW58_9ACTN|nr:DUF5926 family protein [Nocardioides iriomotensis]RYU10337.1 SEC-C domain-containing protein [Nocardioides iriomotensis]
MGKKSRVKHRSQQETATPGEVGPRQPCPCGSGRRYKACHGSADGPAPAYVARPFAGLADEADVIAMREMVPAATAPVRLRDGVTDADRAVVLCSLLPGAAPGLVRQDGTIWLGLQVQHAFGDPSRELAAVLEKALAAEPGDVVGLTAAPAEGPRLQDLLTDDPLEVTVHRGFDFWVADVDDPTGAIASSLEAANAAAHPAARLTSVDAAYWTDVSTKEHLRWVMPHDDEEQLLSALARLHAAGKDSLVEGSRLVGMFRTNGVLVPVWDLPLGTGAEVLEEPAAAFRKHLDAALADDSPLSTEERSARSGLANRQLTIR